MSLWIYCDIYTEIADGIGIDVIKFCNLCSNSGQRRGAPASRRIGGGGGGGRGGMRGRGQGKRTGPPKKVVSADDLDKDLDKYHSEAMQTN